MVKCTFEPGVRDWDSEDLMNISIIIDIIIIIWNQINLLRESYLQSSNILTRNHLYLQIKEDSLLLIFLNNLDKINKRIKANRMMSLTRESSKSRLMNQCWISIEPQWLRMLHSIQTEWRKFGRSVEWRRTHQRKSNGSNSMKRLESSMTRWS